MKRGMAVLLAATLAVNGCVWRYSLHGGGLPSHIRNVAILPFENQTGSTELQRELTDQTYVPQPLQEIVVSKGPKSNGTRTLHLPAVRDKIAQEAFRATMQPILERRFADCSYGYRERKGPARAIARVNHYLVSMKRRWVVSADIDNCFPSLDQGILLKAVDEAFHDSELSRLIELWCKMGSIASDGNWNDGHSGIHQGNVLSPLLANLYLNPFDRMMTRRGAGSFATPTIS